MSCLALLCLLLGAVPPKPPPPPAVAPPPAVREMVQRILGDEAFVALERPFDPARALAPPVPVYAFALSPPSVQSWPGAGNVGPSACMVDQAGLWLQVGAEMHMRIVDAPLHTKDEVEAAATAFVMRHWAHLFEGAVPHVETEPWLEPQSDSMRVVIEARMREITYYRLQIWVNPWNLRISGVHWEAFPAPAEGYGEGLLAPREAAALVRRLPARGLPVEVYSTSVRPAVPVRRGVPAYKVVLPAIELGTRVARQVEALVNARDGSIVLEPEVRPQQQCWHGYPQHVAPNVVQSRQPRWTKEGLAFISDLSISGLPWTCRLDDQAYLRRADGSIGALTCDAGSEVRRLGGTAGGSWLMLARAWRWRSMLSTEALDLATGRLAMAGFGENWPADMLPPDRYPIGGPGEVSLGAPPPGLLPAGPGGAPLLPVRPEDCLFQPTVSLDGAWAWGIGAPYEGRLLCTPLDPAATALARRGVIGPSGGFTCPCVSEDGQWLYYARENKGARFVCRVPLAAVSRGPVSNPEALPVTELAQAPLPVTDITEAGGQLVVSMATEPQRPDRMYWSHVRMGGDGSNPQALALPVAKDPDTGEGIGAVQDVVAGPGAGCVTFSALVNTARGPARRIYQLELATGALTGLTPALDQPVPLYRFGGGPSAMEVGLKLIAAEYALAEPNMRRLPMDWLPKPP